MCGITGLISQDPTLPAEQLASLARDMARAIRHRGPDAFGLWDEDAGVALAHRRLSIIDLSAAANQPMLSACGRWVLIFNGECYNFGELRDKLNRSANVEWRTRSDTEVVVEAIAHWGFEKALPEFNAMFALAAYDRSQSRLYLARDRVGKKPLYYANIGKTLLFGSELKALMACRSLPRRIDERAAADYLRFGYVPGEQCILEGVKKVAPAAYVSVELTNERGLNVSEQTTYWSLEQRAVSSGEAPSLAQKRTELERLLTDSVDKRLISDVPIGCLLSGGIDSSLVTALAVRTNPTGQKIKTFSVGFRESKFDESGYAREIARHLDTNHTELTLTHDMAMDAIHKLPQIYDEPLADASQVPTYLIAKLARQHVTVVLTGDGGDEGFLGYSRYVRKLEQWRKIRSLPWALRRSSASALRCIAALSERLPGRDATAQYSDKLFRSSYLLGSRDSAAAYFHGMSIGHSPHRLLRGVAAGSSQADVFEQRIEDPARNFARIDQLTYLPDDVLCKVDRATMAVSLEARSPLLDYRVLEASWQFTTPELLSGGSGKQPLRALLDEMVPRSMTDRPKMGFGIPIAEWLRGPLKTWANGILIDDTSLDPILDRDQVRHLWHGFLGGADTLAGVVWALLSLKMWAIEYECNC